jgi:hypothetical protein
MGIEKTIKKGIDNAIKAPMDSMKRFGNGIANFVTDTLLELLIEFGNTVMSPIMKGVNGIVSGFNKLKGWVMTGINFATSIFDLIFFYIKCTIKLLTNFYKCAIFYVLDVVKYLILYLPIFIILNLLGLRKQWNKFQTELDKVLGWPNGVQNDCYRCAKKPDESKTSLLDMFKIFQEKEKETESKFNFLFFLFVFSVGGWMMYTFWHMYIRQNF